MTRESWVKRKCRDLFAVCECVSKTPAVCSELKDLLFHWWLCDALDSVPSSFWQHTLPTAYTVPLLNLPMSLLLRLYLSHQKWFSASPPLTPVVIQAPIMKIIPLIRVFIFRGTHGARLRPCQRTSRARLLGEQPPTEGESKVIKTRKVRNWKTGNQRIQSFVSAFDTTPPKWHRTCVWCHVRFGFKTSEQTQHKIRSVPSGFPSSSVHRNVILWNAFISTSSLFGQWKYIP